MSTEKFIELLQTLLTMVDPKNEVSKACVKTTLENVFALAKDSGKADQHTLITMRRTISIIDRLIDYRKDFAGKPGDFKGNQAKRFHLMNMLMPGC